MKNMNRIAAGMVLTVMACTAPIFMGGQALAGPREEQVPAVDKPETPAATQPKPPEPTKKPAAPTGKPMPRAYKREVPQPEARPAPVTEPARRGGYGAHPIRNKEGTGESD